MKLVNENIDLFNGVKWVQFTTDKKTTLGVIDDLQTSLNNKINILKNQQGFLKEYNKNISKTKDSYKLTENNIEVFKDNEIKDLGINLTKVLETKIIPSSLPKKTST